MLINADIPALQDDIFTKFEAMMRDRSPHFLSKTYQTTVLEAMKETRGVNLPNFMNPELHSNLIHVELRLLVRPAEELLAQSRACLDNVLSMLSWFIYISL